MMETSRGEAGERTSIPRHHQPSVVSMDCTPVRSNACFSSLANLQVVTYISFTISSKQMSYESVRYVTAAWAYDHATMGDVSFHVRCSLTGRQEEDALPIECT
mmetsp:Transcript_8236/g.12007  ORF Transcript_8236/g.12007 Transcript_8236/m.12007 type:complete len:103 (-) Transcript_8236:130-438(-)